MCFLSVSFLPLVKKQLKVQLPTQALKKHSLVRQLLLKVQQIGTVTDINGNFSIDVPKGSTVLSVSFVGFTSTEVAIGADPNINIALSSGRMASL